MEIKIVFKHIEHTESLDSRIKEKSQKLEKFLGGVSKLHWTCSVQDGTHKAEIKLMGPKYVYHSSGSSDSLYKALDLAVQKIERQLGKHKDKWKQRKGDTGLHDLEILEPEVAWQDYDEDSFDDAG